MDLTGEKFQAMKTAYNLAFRNAFDSQVSTCEQFAMFVGDAAHSIIEFPFLEQFSGMREWIGPRQLKNLSGKSLKLTERDFEDTIGVKARDLETDNWGLYMPAIQQMAVNGKQIWDELAVEALCAAGKWIDGKNFFATDRKYGDKSTISNKTTDALSVTSYKAAFAAMGQFTGHMNKPLGIRPDTLMVGPALEFKAREILENEFISDGTTTVNNPARGTAKLIVNPRISGDYVNYWFLMQTAGPIKPVVVQKSKEAALISRNSPTDENVFMEGKALFGTEAHGSAAAAFPHLIYGGIVSAS